MTEQNIVPMRQQMTYMDRTRRFVSDSFTNFISGLGVLGRDKATGQAYSLNLLDAAQLEYAYRGDWIARKVIDLPALDMTRQWRAWQADKDDITKLERIERNFRVQLKLQQGITKARLYGGAVILMGVDDGKKPEEPMNLDAVTEGSLKFLHVLGRWQVATGQKILDLLSPWYGEPEYYEARQHNPTGTQPQVRMHPSRVIRLIGLPYPEETTAPDVWGDSALQPVDDAVKASGLVSGSLATLISELKVDVIKTPGLAEQMATDASTQKVIDRFSKANVGKSIINTLLLDKGEEWTRLQTSLAGVPEVLQMYLLIAAGAADIPATRFLGRSPQGMNATGESDIRNYYDRLASEQSTHLTPNISSLDQVIQRTALGKYDEGVIYNWNSLWQMSDVEKADISFKKAQTYKIDADEGLIPTTALAHARINQLEEDGFYPGLEQALEDAEAAGDTVESHNEPPPELPPVGPGGAPMPRLPGRPGQRLLPPPGRRNAQPLRVDRRRLDDAKPRPLFVCRELINADEFTAWAEGQGFKNVVDDAHVTVLYSRVPVDWMALGTDYGYISGEDDGTVRVPPGGPRVIEPLGDEGAVVLLFVSNRLTYRHMQMVENGASHDYDEYVPHVTITYDGSGVDLDEVEPYAGELIFGPEVFREIDLGGGQDHFPFV